MWWCFFKFATRGSFLSRSKSGTSLAEECILGAGEEGMTVNSAKWQTIEYCLKFHKYLIIFWQIQGVYTFPLYSLICEYVFKYAVIFHACIRYTKWSKIAPEITSVSSLAVREFSSERTPEKEAGGGGAVKLWRVKIPQCICQGTTYHGDKAWPPEGHPWDTPEMPQGSTSVPASTYCHWGCVAGNNEKWSLLDLCGSVLNHFSQNAMQTKLENYISSGL